MGEFGRRAMFEIMGALPGGTMISNNRKVSNVNTIYEQEEQLPEKQKSNIKMETVNEQKKEEKKNSIELPTTIRKPIRVNPATLIIYGKPKSGKTTAVAQLPNMLLVDVEKGSAFIEAMIVSPPDTVGPVGKFKWLRDLAKKIKDADRPYDYVVIDTLSQLDTDAEWVGTWNYMNSIAGKNFNRDTNGAMLKPTDPNYESVLSLAHGYGYRYTRDAIMDIYADLNDLGRICTIFICHVADKMIANKSGDEVMIKDLALTGKLRDVVPRLCDAIGNVWNEDGKIMISFIGDNEKIGGVRAKHLMGYSGEADWSKIFIKE